MRPSRLLSFVPSLHRAPSRLPKPITRSAHRAHNGLTQTIGKRFLHSSSTFLPTFNWTPIAVAAIIGGGISALDWDDASAAESPLTVESWKKSLETVLNKNPEDMQLEHFLAAVEVTMATVDKIPPEELKESFEHVHRVFVRLTTLLLEMEIYEGALRFQEQFIKLCETHNIGTQYPAIYSYALNDIGETYWEMKDTKKAAKFYSHNIRFNENLKRHTNNSSIGTLLDLQLAYGKLALCQATEMKKSTSDKDVPTSIRKLINLQQSLITQISSKDGCKPSKKIIATISAVNTLLELANIFLEKGRTQDCLTYFQEASEICSKFSAFDKEFKGKQDGKATSSSSSSSSSSRSSSSSSSIPSLADTRDNIELSRSACITRLGRHQEAEQIVRDLLNQQLKRVGTNSPLLIPTYNNLGYILSAQRHFAESETYLRKGIALAIQQKQNTLEYAQKTFEMQHLLSGVLLAQHKHDQAIDILQKNLVLGSRIFGSSSTLMVETYAQLGFSFRSAGDLTRSLDYLNKAYTFGLDTLSLSSPLAYKIGTEYAFALAESGNFKEAEKIFTSTKTGILNSYGSQSIQHVMATVKMASLYEKMGEYNKSEVEYNAALKIARRLNPSPQRELTIANCEVSLGKIFTGMRRYKEAKSCLDSAIAKLKEADNPLPLALAYSALSNWYLLSGQLKQAVVSLDNAWETLKESSAPLDSPEAIDMQLEMAELHTRHRTPEISIQALESLLSTVQSSETLSYAQKRNIKDRIDEKLRAAEQAVASK